MTRSSLIALAAVLGALAVAAGAFGAHALRTRVGAEAIGTWETAARYHMIHALAVLSIALGVPAPRATLPAALLTAGVVLFSGSLYALVLSGTRWLGAVTPLGGLCLIAGWLSLLWAAR